MADRTVTLGEWLDVLESYAQGQTTADKVMATARRGYAPVSPVQVIAALDDAGPLLDQLGDVLLSVEAPERANECREVAYKVHAAKKSLAALLASRGGAK